MKANEARGCRVDALLIAVMGGRGARWHVHAEAQ